LAKTQLFIAQASPSDPVHMARYTLFEAEILNRAGLPMVVISARSSQHDPSDFADLVDQLAQEAPSAGPKGGRMHSSVMVRNSGQFKKDLSLLEFQHSYGREEQCDAGL
jgi:hypothetical protein